MAKKKPNRPPTKIASAAAHAAELSRAQRDRKLMQRRVEGLSIRELADEFSLSVGRVHAILARERGALIEDTQELALEYRSKQLETLEQIQLKWLPRVMHPDADAPVLQAFLKALAHEAALVGANAATKTELTGANGGPMQTNSSVVHGLDFSGLTSEELRVLEKLALRNSKPADPDDD